MAKSRVAIAVDSTAYIPPGLVKKYNIHVIPQILNWEGESLLDDVDIKPVAFYERLKTAKEMPTTSQPSAGEFHDFFVNITETADSIVGIFVSDDLSGTLDSARTAAKMMGDFPLEIVDSRTTSMGLGFLVLEAARAAEEGLNHLEVAEAVQALIPKMHVLFVVDTLEFLHRGGRIVGSVSFLA
ncbi:unnamed protein product [marine sediment metagenome]|uniref:DegV family protein n=1 Tax=marine sediment metagenome TaxID=412755 RepID=X0Z185_9ZZZZ